MSKFQFILHSASNLPKADVIGSIDPYAKIKIPCETTQKEYTTPFLKENVNPTWNFECPSEIYLNTSADIVVEIWDKDTLKKDDYVSYCNISIGDVLSKPYKEKTFALTCVGNYTPFEKEKEATITISAFYTSFRN